MRVLAATAALVLAFLASPVHSSNSQAVAKQSTVPVSGEPRHHLKFENKYVRVYDVVVPPADATLFHLHAQDYIFVMIGAATLKAQVLGSDPYDLILKDGEVRFSKAPLTHRVTNVGNVDFRNITIELLDSPGRLADAKPLEQAGGHSLVMENERVKVERLTLEPGQSTGVHSHGFAELGVAISGGTLEDQVPGEKPRSIELNPGEFRWHGEARTHSLKNIGKAKAEVIAIEWK